MNHSKKITIPEEYTDDRKKIYLDVENDKEIYVIKNTCEKATKIIFKKTNELPNEVNVSRQIQRVERITNPLQKIQGTTKIYLWFFLPKKILEKKIEKCFVPSTGKFLVCELK